jgi:hypothetical protein
VSHERFIYYDVAQPTPALRAALLAMQHALRARHPRLQARLLCKGGNGGGETWMETYAHPGGVDDALLDEIEALAVPIVSAHGCGPRYVETFTPCAS